jgi:hypothetical protein
MILFLYTECNGIFSICNLVNFFSQKIKNISFEIAQ